MAEARSQLTRARIRDAWTFLTPMIVVLALVAGWPLLRTIWLSLTDASLADLDAAQFIGFENYTFLITDPLWWQAVWNTVWFSVISVTLEVILGMIFALVLDASFRGQSLVRAAVLIPWAIPTIVSAQMWGWMYHDQFGVINDLLLSVGLIDEAVAWTADPDLAMFAVIMVDVWKTTPFMALLILAGLQMLPRDCYEAARVDGIHPVVVFFKVTLPLVRPALMVAVVFRALDALRVFDLIYVLTSNSQDTMTMSIYARQELVDFQSVGYGSAASTLLFFIVALFTAVYLIAGRVKFDAD